jgi:hypothetical protein
MMRGRGRSTIADIAGESTAQPDGVGRRSTRAHPRIGRICRGRRYGNQFCGRAICAAIASFVDTPQQTLVIKLTPVGKLLALQLLQLLKTDPLLALAQFKVEASTGLQEALRLVRQIEPDVKLAQLLGRDL